MTYTYKEIKDYDATTTPSLTDLLLKQESTGGIYETITPNDILSLLSVSLLPSDVMLKSVYDTDTNGVINKSSLVPDTTVANHLVSLNATNTGLTDSNILASDVMLKSTYDTNTDGVIDTTALPTIPVSKGGTGTDLSTSTGLVKMASGVASVASLLRSELPTGTLCVDSAISSTAQYVKDKDGNTSALSLSNGNVGIGTSSQTNAKLELKQSNDTDGFRLWGYNDPNAYFDFFISVNNNPRFSTNRSMVFETASISSLFFRSGTAGTFFNDLPGAASLTDFNNGQLRITSTGNVGIGTTTPGAKLHVNGNIRCVLPTSASGLSSGDLWRDASGYVRIV